MHINHDLGKEVWFQPLAVARHHEHGTFGSDSVSLMQAGQKVFAKKWAGPLQRTFGATPWQESPSRYSRPETADEVKFQIFCTWTRSFQIRMLGAGYGRAVDNLEMLAELGYKVTATATADT